MQTYTCTLKALGESRHFSAYRSRRILTVWHKGVILYQSSDCSTCNSAVWDKQRFTPSELTDRGFESSFEVPPPQCHHMSFVEFVVLPLGHGRSVTDF